MSDAPKFMWIDWREANRHFAAFDEPPSPDWPDCTVAVVRRDPATLAEMPEVQAMVAAAYQRAADAIKDEFKVTAHEIDGMTVYGCEVATPASCYKTILDLIDQPSAPCGKEPPNE